MISKEFIGKYVKQFEKTSYRNGIGVNQLFYDFIFFYTSKMRAYGEGHKKSIEEYKVLDAKYSDEIKNLFDETMKDLISALNEQQDDYLGRMYMRLGVNKKGLGQYYTPFHVSRLMAEASLSNVSNRDDKEPLTISDPTCGSGSMLIATVSVLKEKNINYALDVVLYAQDLDPLAASMCYLQLSALGAAAVVNIGNTITMDIYDSLPTLALIGQTHIKELYRAFAS